MRVFLASVTGERQYVKGLASLERIKMQEGDHVDCRYNTSGEFARTGLLDEFWHHPDFTNPDDAILMLDLDMDHPGDLLERLRAHDLDMVSAHYFRREQPLLSVWQYPAPDGKWPYVPILDVPESGMHELAVTGMGCVLIKRKVIADVWEDLPKGDNPFAKGMLPELSGDHRRWGSDFRFFSMARAKGYTLWGDASLESKHADIWWSDRTLYKQLGHKHAHGELLRTYWIKRLELHGMDKTTVEARITFLEDQLSLHVNAINTKRAELAELERRALTLQAGIEENKNWLKGEIEANPQKGKIPVFESEEALDAALAARKNSQ